MSQSDMPKKKKKQKKEELPAPEEFAARHGIAVDTARALLGTDEEAPAKSDGACASAEHS